MTTRLKAPVVSPSADMIEASTKISIRCSSEHADVFYTVRRAAQLTL